LTDAWRRGAAAALVAVIALAVLGCASSQSGSTDGARGGASSTPSGPRIRSTASLAINEPSPGAAVPAGKMSVRLTLTGGRVIPDTTTRLAPDEGHIHLLLDGKVISMTYGVEQQITVTAGPHVLEAEFVANDHFSFEPRVITTVTFVAK
jgi:hypothetical protein